MSAASNYLENALGNAVLRNTAYSSPAAVYLALYTSSPAEDASGAEVTDAGSYARTAITFGAPSNGAFTQSAQVTFPTATGNWGTVTHWALYDSGTHGAGNLLVFGAFSGSIAVVTGNTPFVANAAIVVTLA